MNLLFSKRESLNDQTFFEIYFKDLNVDPEIPAKVRKIFSNILGFDFSKISDSDDFSKELQIIWDIDSMANVEIITKIEEEFKIEISDEEAEAATTLKILILLIDKKRKNK